MTKNKREIEQRFAEEIIKQLVNIFITNRKNDPQNNLDLYALLFAQTHFALIYEQLYKQPEFSKHKNLNLEKIINYTIVGIVGIITKAHAKPSLLKADGSKLKLLH